MWDKTFLFLVIFLIIAGAFTYDQFLIARGEVSPVSQILDFAGVANFIPWPEERITFSRHKFRYNKRDNLIRLRRKLVAIQNQRDELIEERRRILSRLRKLNDQIVQEARKYYEVIVDERAHFKEYIPLLERIGERIVEVSKIEDPELREAEYAKVRAELLELLRRMVPNPEKDMPRLVEILRKLDNIIKADDYLIDACPDIVTCLRPYLDEINLETVRLINRILDVPEEQLEKIQELSDMLAKEYLILAENHEASEIQLRESSVEIDSEFKRLTEKLVEVTDEDFGDLMDLYEELYLEQDLLLQNLALNRERLDHNQKIVDEKMAEIIEKLKSIPKDTLNQLVEVIDDLKQKGDSLLADFNSNEDMIHDLTRQRWDESKRFIDEWSDEIDFKWRKLVDDREYLEEKSSLTKSIRDPKKSMAQDSKNDSLQNRNPYLQDYENLQSRNLRKIEQNRKVIDQRVPVQYDMKRLREKARDQGYYD